MNKEITIVTMTANRAKDFANLQSYIQSQTFRNFDWIVVKDTEVPYPKPIAGERRIQREKQENELHSMLENLRAGLAEVQTPYIAIFEDDDWFSPDYLETMVGMLRENDLAGFNMEVVYRPSDRTFSRAWNVGHASLSATGWRHQTITPIVDSIIEEGSVYVDSMLWQTVSGMEGYSTKLKENTEREGDKGLLYHLGIKGASGASPIHTRELTSSDKSGALLRSWIGKDAERYLGGI